MANPALSTKQHAAIEALLTCRTIAEAALTAGVNRKTLGTWLATDVAFCDVLRRARAGVLDHTVRRLTSLSATAIDTLDSSMAGDNAAVALRAADITLSRLLALAELHDLSERLAALEAARHGTD